MATKLASKSEHLYKRARELIPGGVNSPVRNYSPYPLFVASAKGSRFRTVDGEEFLDYCMAYGALLDGHAYEEVVEAVQKAMGRGSLYGQPTEMEVELASLISSLVPSMEMVRLVNSGTEATMHSLRLARAFTGRQKILNFGGGDHGIQNCSRWRSRILQDQTRHDRAREDFGGRTSDSSFWRSKGNYEETCPAGRSLPGWNLQRQSCKRRSLPGHASITETK